jgi:cation diffusion facilitator CzcD-associated flavoprotein CzcO
MNDKNKIHDCGDTVCIIGAGPGGLCMARALKRQGLSYEQFERHSGVGGVWDINNPGTPMYESAHFISSRDLSGFLDYPMPKLFPDYPSNRQILEYVNSFAHAFDLYANIRFNTSVDKVLKRDDGRWLVTLSGGEQRLYRAVVCATGCNWDANMPEVKGQFNGEIRHSVTYKKAEEFKGKKVMIIGAGNSGADIACDAATHAQKAFISLRRGYHMIPKHLFGLPVDEVSEKGPQLPIWLTRIAFQLILRVINGDVRRFGLPKPDHKLFESHPLLNAQLLHYLQHGDIQVKPDVSHYDGDHVVFKDGSREQLDLVLYATGYKWSCKYAADYFEWKGGRPQLYLSIFSRQHHNLFGIGYLETNSSAYKLFDNEAHAVACYLRDQLHHPERARQFDQLIAHDNPDLSGGIDFVKSQRHEVYLEVHAFKKHLRKVRQQMGWGDLDEGYYGVLRQSSGYVPVDLPQTA